MWSNDKLKPLFPQLSIDTAGLRGDLYVYLYFSLQAAKASSSDTDFFRRTSGRNMRTFQESNTIFYNLIMKVNEMHYFSNLFNKVLYMFRTGPLSIIRSISKLYIQVPQEECARLRGGGVFLIIKYTDITQTPMSKVERLRR